MRKRLLTPIPQGIQSQEEGWLDLDRAASVEVTSEEKDYGIEAALVSGKTQGIHPCMCRLHRLRSSFERREFGRPASSADRRRHRHIIQFEA